MDIDNNVFRALGPQLSFKKTYHDLPGIFHLRFEE